MDTFDLRWPQTTATFCTNGWRCRIVWRGKKGNMGGTIENNDLCKRRVADSLDGAPGLLAELRAAGHVDLAEEIETLAPELAPRAARMPARKPHRTHAAKPASPPSSRSKQADRPPAPAPGELIDNWAAALSGSSHWEACSNRRAKSWLEVAQVEVAAGDDAWCEDVLLKAPAAKGKQEWVLKCVWQAAPKGDGRAAPRFYSAESFHGICACVAAQEEYRSIAFVDAFIGAFVGAPATGLKELVEKYSDVAQAVDGWAAQKAILEKPQSVH